MNTKRKIDLREIRQWGDRDAKVFDRQDALFKHLDAKKRKDLRGFSLESDSNILGKLRKGAMIEMFKDPEKQREEVVIPQKRFFLAATYADVYKYLHNVDDTDADFDETPEETDLASVYEIIRQDTHCHLYFDLEAEYHKQDTISTPTIHLSQNDVKPQPVKGHTCPLSCKTQFNPSALLDTLIRELDTMLHTVYGVRVRKEDAVKLISDYTHKYSAHVVVHLQDAVFKSNQHMGRFLTAFVQKLAEKAATDASLHGAMFYHKIDDGVEAVRQHPKDVPPTQDIINRAARGALNFERSLVPVIDLAVYTRNRTFRCMSASKLGKKSHLHFDEQDCAFPFHSHYELFLATLICNVDINSATTFLEYGIDKVKKTHLVAPGTGLQRASYGGSGPKSGPSPIPELDTFIKNTLKRTPYSSGYIGRWCMNDMSMLYTVEGTRYCHNVGRCHKSNGVYLLVYFSRLTYAQRCYDHDCQGFTSKELPIDMAAECGVRQYFGTTVEHKPYAPPKPQPFDPSKVVRRPARTPPAVLSVPPPPPPPPNSKPAICNPKPYVPKPRPFDPSKVVRRPALTPPAPTSHPAPVGEALDAQLQIPKKQAITGTTIAPVAHRPVPFEVKTASCASATGSVSLAAASPAAPATPNSRKPMPFNPKLVSRPIAVLDQSTTSLSPIPNSGGSSNSPDAAQAALKRHLPQDAAGAKERHKDVMKNEKQPRRFRLVFLVGLCGGLTLLGVLVHVLTFNFNDKTGAEELKSQLTMLQNERKALQRDARAKEKEKQEKKSEGKGEMAAWQDEEEWAQPSVVIEEGVRLKKAEWRLNKDGKCRDGDKVIEGYTFMAHDICQLGHIPKDATHLFVYLASGGRLDNIIYGSECMTRDEKNLAAPYSRTWHSATKHWFTTVLDLWGMPYTTYYFSEGVRDVCVTNLIRRSERWRWFPGHRTAWSFRRALQSHFKLTVPVKEYGKGPLVVSVLKRLEDRNFDEDATARFLESKFGKVANFEVMIFDNKGRVLSDQAALTYTEQLQKLAATDIFIAAHGAAMTNVVAMRRGSAVIELFPNNFRYYMFEELSRLLGINYHSHEAVDPPVKCKDCSGRKGTPSLETPHAFHGSKSCKKCNIHISDQDWYYLFKDAASTVWLSLRYVTPITLNPPHSRRSDIHKFDVRKNK